MNDQASTSQLTPLAAGFIGAFSTLAFVFVVMVVKHFVARGKKGEKKEKRVYANVSRFMPFRVAVHGVDDLVG
jgi:hypothetical protein